MLQVVLHPLFQNISYREAEAQLGADAANDGDCIVRPSTKENYLTLTWRVYKGVYQHVRLIAFFPPHPNLIHLCRYPSKSRTRSRASPSARRSL